MIKYIRTSVTSFASVKCSCHFLLNLSLSPICGINSFIKFDVKYAIESLSIQFSVNQYMHNVYVCVCIQKKDISLNYFTKNVNNQFRADN